MEKASKFEKNLWKYLLKYKNEDVIVIFDTMNYTLSSTAIKFCKKYGKCKVGVLTDNPLNITNMRKFVAKKLISNMQKCDKYITLTNGLLKLAKGENKPHFLVEGIFEDVECGQIKKHRPYFFFGGALSTKWGVKDLILAYLIVDPPYDLIIAGHGKGSKFVKKSASLNPKIKYVGYLTKGEILKYEQRAILNINPRPYNHLINEDSIPSKVIEYAGSGAPVLSTYHEKLHSVYKTSILWCKGTGIDDLKEAMTSFLKLTPEQRIELGERCKNITKKHYSLGVVGKSISKLLQNNPK